MNDILFTFFLLFCNGVQVEAQEHRHIQTEGGPQILIGDRFTRGNMISTVNYEADTLTGIESTSNEIASTPSETDSNSFNTRVMYLPLGAIGLVGNALVLIAIGSNPRMRQRLSNMLIFNQAAIDLCSSAILMLMRFLGFLSPGMTDGTWADVLCHVWDSNMLLWGTFLSSTLNLLLLALERYFAILHPITYQVAFTPKKVKIIICFVWVLGTVFQAAHLVPSTDHHQGECRFSYYWPSSAARSVVGIAIVMVHLVIPVIIMIFVYVRIIWHLNKEKRFTKYSETKERHPGSGASTESTPGMEEPATANDPRGELFNKARRNMIRTLVSVSVAFFVCWVGNLTYYFLYIIGFPLTFHSIFYHVSVVLVFSNCCVNPFIYVLQYQDFQNSLARVFCGCHPSAKEKSTSLSTLSTTDDSKGRI